MKYNGAILIAKVKAEVLSTGEIETEITKQDSITC